MEEEYRRWHKVQVISSIIYAFFMILLWLATYFESSHTLMITMAVVATASLVTTIVSGLIRAYIGYKSGIKSTKKDLVIVIIAFILTIIYLAIKYH